MEAGDENIVSVCGFCEREKGKAQLQPGQVPSHGLCRRHSKEMYMADPLRMSDEEAEAKTAHIQPRYWHDQPR